MQDLEALTAFFSPLRTHAFAYPALEVVHIVGIALLLGNLVLLELRVWGVGADLPVSGLARMALALVATGFGLAGLSGLLMFVSQASDLIANRAFVLKMGLLGLAAANAVWFHRRSSLIKLDAIARLQGVASTLIWVMAIGCGRWIAYI